MSSSEEQLRTIIDSIPTLVWSANADGAVNFFNRRWLDYTGLSAEQARDWGWTLAIHPDDRTRLVDYWRSILASGQSGEVEARLHRFDGAYRWFLFRGTPLRDPSGTVVQWCGTNTDIDDRKRAEEALRASELDFRLILDSIPGLVVTMTAEGEVEFVSQRMLFRGLGSSVRETERRSWGI
jgi:PAS domain S-box-containing protein